MTNLEFYRENPDGLAKAVVEMCDSFSPDGCINSCESCYAKFFRGEYVEKKRKSVTVVANIAFTCEIPDYIIREGEAAVEKYAQKFSEACKRVAESGLESRGFSSDEINITDGAIQMFTFGDEVSNEVLSDNR